MALLYINTGTSSNKGDGDTLRVAFTKINGMFNELYNTVVTPVATVSTAGVVKPGVGLSIALDGTMNVTGEASTSTLTILDNTGRPRVDIVSYAGTATLSSNKVSPTPLFTFDKTKYQSASIDIFATDVTADTQDMGSGYTVSWWGSSAKIIGNGLICMNNQGSTNNATWDLTSATVTATGVTVIAYNVSTSTSHTINWKAKVSLFRI
jgi:hypothetical protein